ncbi:MAG: helix-turn-helix domain-containing protein [Defluviitaleaceae bacterium]|nr:helix-turn-helix domain-containing protein [Defluviitaleaceae bacterium]MCL2240884.1 helix-turn-helix domain-containing protein [Defluviitaleaceae bacterium]
MTIGDKIKFLRTKRGLSQSALGKLCGIADANIRKYESGKILPKYDTASKIANALNVRVTYLLDVYEDLAEKLDNNSYAISDHLESIKNVDEAEITARFHLHSLFSHFRNSLHDLDLPIGDMIKEIDSFLDYMLAKYNLKNTPLVPLTNNDSSD